MALSPAQRHSQRIAMEQKLKRSQALETTESMHLLIRALEKDVEHVRSLPTIADRVEYKRDVLLPRWVPTVEGKMLRNLPKLLHIREMPEIQAVRIYLQGGGYRNGETPVPAGTVGYAQQNGMRVKVSRSNQPRKAEAGKMATPAQAKKLRALGYRVKTGKRWKKPTLGEITQTMPYSQAGLLIRKLSGKAVKTSWTVDLPARVFLGMNDDEFDKALARQLQAIGFGWDVKAQDIKGKA